MAPRGVDPVAIGCNLLFALLLLIPTAGLVLAGLVLLLSVPLLVALFPTALTLGAIALAFLFWRHRRERRRRARLTANDGRGPAPTEPPEPPPP